MAEIAQAGSQQIVFLDAVFVFDFPITQNETNGGQVLRRVVKRGEFINDGTIFRTGVATQFFDKEVSCHLRADEDEADEVAVGNALSGQPLRVHADHGGEVAACRMSGEKDFFRIAAALRDVPERPSRDGSRILKIAGCSTFGERR